MIKNLYTNRQTLVEKRFHIGDSVNIISPGESNYNIAFRPNDIFNSWETAGNLADSIASFFYEKNPGQINRNAISMVLNELIENAAKFSKDPGSKVEIETIKGNNSIKIITKNEVTAEKWEKLEKVTRELFSSDLHKLFKERLFSIRKDTKSPGLGLILLKKDYNSNLNFLFEKHDDGRMEVSITVEMPI